MKRLVVGGDFGTAKKSTIAKALSTELFADIFNGGTIEQINNAKNMIVDYDLVVWMPNINNEVSKQYPIKKKGSVLICSKVLREGTTVGDAVARIFKMNANAVIAIDASKEHYVFKLIDALGNLWVETDMVDELGKAIEKLAWWTKHSIRKNCELDTISSENSSTVSNDFCEIVQNC